MKKFIAYVGSIICLLSVLLFSACSLFDSETLNGNQNDSNNSNNENGSDLSQFYSKDCPITLGEKTAILYSSDLQMIFENSSDKNIIAYEAIVILYDVYGEALRYAWNDSIYNKLAETPSGFSPQKEDIQYISITNKVYTAEIYVYFVLFDDQTSWGYRKNITIDDILKYCTCIKVVKG